MKEDKKMKNHIKLAILSISLVGLASCDMDAPSISTLDESSVFATYSLAESEVMSIHVSFGETNSYRGRFLPYYGVNTDVEWGNAPSYADRVSDKNRYVKSFKINGQLQNRLYVTFDDIQNGGVWEFEMSPRPAKSANKTHPYSLTK